MKGKEKTKQAFSISWFSFFKRNVNGSLLYQAAFVQDHIGEYTGANTLDPHGCSGRHILYRLRFLIVKAAGDSGQRVAGIKHYSGMSVGIDLGIGDPAGNDDQLVDIQFVRGCFILLVFFYQVNGIDSSKRC
jgi:hypothetical protein